MTSDSANASESNGLLTVPEVATRLRLHPTTVSKLCRTGHLGAFRAGNGRGRWRIPLSGIDAYNEDRTPQIA
jgi:excisionase family DNA binding protein